LAVRDHAPWYARLHLTARLLQEAGFRSPSVSWQPLYRFGKAGERLFSNEAAAYFLKGLFRLEMQKA
jgi:hypothetical protein